MNEQAVLGCRRPGEGRFIKALDRELKRRRLTVSVFEHDLAAELRGKRQAVIASGAQRTMGADLRPAGRRGGRLSRWAATWRSAWIR